MNTLHRLASASLFLAILGHAAFAEVKTFRTVPGDPKNVVEFESKATIEHILGHTSSITGTVEVDLTDVAATKTAQFDVDLNTLDTGIGLRNEHMRDNYLETAKYPSASFRLTRIVSSDKASLSAGESANVVAEGEFTIHGVSKTYQIPLTIYYDKTSDATSSRLNGAKGDILVVTGDWMLKLADHNIQRPEFLVLKLATDQKVSVNFAMTDLLPESK